MSGAMRWILIPGALALSISCGLLIDIPDSSGITCCPDTENQVLTEQQRPSIRFAFEVDKGSVEALISVRDSGGALQGYCLWDDRTVYFHAQSELIPGRRYVFSFSGSFNEAGGAACSVHHIVPFYFRQRDESPPRVLSCEPESGQMIARDTAIRILFSEPVEPASLAGGLSVEPDTPIHTGWENAQTVLVLKPQQYWPHCARLTVEVNESIQDAAAVPLAEARKFVFWVQEDVEPPELESVQPVRNDPAELFPPTGADIREPLGLKEGLCITFSEAMDCEPTAGALGIQPSIAISRLWLDSSRLVVLPLDRFEPQTGYCLRFGEEAADPAGNPLAGGGPVQFFTIP
ncbi:MAG: Ig-like domain-containing protein, partial [Spirochaetales bacterium]|nr:Ig-like domain-containing protein [Spirochaetales bacterium]